MRITSALAVSSLASGAFAQATTNRTNYLGFNSGATLDNSTPKTEEDFLAEFRAARNLPGTQGMFTSFRLFTNCKPNTDDPIDAFSAAVKTNTSLLLGLWASGTTSISSEIICLQKAISKHGSNFTDLVIGIVVGSEDVYRISESGMRNKAGVGNPPEVIVGFVGVVRRAVANTTLQNVPIGHVEPWETWANKTMAPVIEAVDFIGSDPYSYYQDNKDNDITNIGSLFDEAFRVTQEATNKPIWITEIGWPSSGPKWGNGIPSVDNAKHFWITIGCGKLFNKMPTFWYILRDSNPANEMKFAITEQESGKPGDQRKLEKPLFDLSCPAGSGSGFDSTSPASTNPKVDSVRGGASQHKVSAMMYAGAIAATAFFVL